MAKSSKKPAEPATEPIVPRIGDKVTIPRSSGALEVEQVSRDGSEVTLRLPGTNLQWFRIPAETLTYVERKPPTKTSNPFSTPEPTLNAAEVLEHIDIVRRESVKQMDDDIDILKSYLKTNDAPISAIEVLEDLTIEHHKSWKSAMGRIKKLL
jgi:hypothetical protein